jgi:hypothetical protein
MNFNKGDILIPQGAQFPEGAVVAEGYDDTGRLLAHPLGGGFQIAFAAEAVGHFRIADEGERERTLFGQARFSLMDSEEHFTAWTNGESWNGWAMPHFEFGEAQRLVAWLKDDKARFDPAEDAFVTVSQDGEEEVWAACSIPVSDGSSIKVYPIGAGCWCWDEVETERGGLL